jgi:S1-C subfamily serine protease
LNGKPVTSADDLVQAITAHKPGDTVAVTINRHGATSTVNVTLGTRPANL